LEKPFRIYKSSAGSGKTRILAREYIRLALRNKDYFRYIVAMTFTNKSTQEMKDRILNYLSDFAQGKSEDLALEIIAEQRESDSAIDLPGLMKKSEEVLLLLLHHYSEFSISTIDAFFQRIIRSFTRETGLLGNFRLEVDNALVMEEVIALLMQQLGRNRELLGWVLDFSMEKLVAGENWDVRTALLDFSKQIEKEEFKTIEEGVLKITSDKNFFQTFRAKLNKEKFTIERTVAERAKNLLDEFRKNQLEISDFKYGSRGSIYSYILDLTKGVKLPGDRLASELEFSDSWPSPSTPNRNLIIAQAEKRWLPQLLSLVEYVKLNFSIYESVDNVLKYLYAFGLLSDIVRTQRKYLADENLMLLSDAPKFLNRLMAEQDASFIYEKVGSFYRHYLLDEFQDTSGLQWNNLLPLIQNGLAQNYSSLIVGDIKQSIYRWRGGNLSILHEQVKQDIHDGLTQTHALDTNYRSDGNLVHFNNAIFETASQLVAAQSGTSFPTSAYADAAQKIVINPSNGFVRIQFLDSSDEELSFKEESLARLPHLVEELQEKGVGIKDIAFIVRDNKDGSLIANAFMEYRVSPNRKEQYRYDVVSNESLLVDKATSIVVLLNALLILDNPTHLIARANLAYEYQKLWPTQAFEDLNEIFSDSKTKNFTKWVPSSFVQQQERLAALPLFEMVENLIHIFNLGKLTEEVVYLQSFQDIIQEFTQREKNDLTSFLTWWELNREKKSVQVAGGVEAAQIITIHRAKGLQFKYVIIPFLDWDLGHGSKKVLLWCKSSDDLFKEAGYMPIQYTSSLADTVFKDSYEEETKRIYLDNLNLLYVAFTRAEAGLIAYAPKVKIVKKKEADLKKIGQLVNKVIQSNHFLQSNWSMETDTYQLGEVQVIGERKKPVHETLALKNYQVTPWRDRLQVRTNGMEFFNPLAHRKKINYGIFLHAILSKIRVKEDLDGAINNSIRLGVISELERSEVREIIAWLLEYPALQACFDPSANIKTETSLFTTDGSERRMDRVVTRENKAWVIDYKTGEPNERDQLQVREYLKLLTDMKWNGVTGFLVYLQERKCVEVKL
jgi:ATP-dependent helicase/nuclease subunit A